MSNTTLSLRRLADHLGRTPQDVRSLRKLLGHPSGPLKLAVRHAPLSVMTHNMGLLVSPAPYLGTDRDGAIAEIVARIRALTPDVVGLCEMFADGERTRIINALSDLYPYYSQGPDDSLSFRSDGGLLLLSRHPTVSINKMTFGPCDGWDCFALKGVIYIRIQPVSWPTPIDIFYSHTQNIETENGVNTLYYQLYAMTQFIETLWDPAIPKIIMGDLNIPGENPLHYDRLLRTLDWPRDCWTLAGNQADSGHTLVRENNFYDDPDDRPSSNHRLDYVLMQAGTRLVPILADIEVLKFQHNGRYISDHFGVRASFDKIAIITHS